METITYKQRIEINQNIRKIKSLISGEITPDIEKYLIKNFEKLLSVVPPIGYDTTFSEPFSRLIINQDVLGVNSSLNSYSQLKYPPKEIEPKLNYNRASLKSTSIFYGGYGSLLAFTEVKPKMGSLITVSKWKQKNDTFIHHYPIFFRKNLNLVSPEFINDYNRILEILRKLNKNTSDVYEEILDFMSEEFQKQVTSEAKINYLVSALFSNLLLNNPKYGIKCLYYPSVAAKFAASNIACLPEVLDAFFDCINVEESMVISDPHNKNGWFTKEIRSVKSVNPLAIGPINWE